MKKIRRLLAVLYVAVLCVGAGFSSSSLAQYQPGGTEISNPYNPNNMWMQGFNLSIQGQINALALKSLMKKGGKTQAQPKQPPYVKARHQYKPNAKSKVLDTFVSAMELEEAQAAQVKAALKEAMGMLQAEAKKRGRQHNMSFAIAILLGSAHFIFYGEEFEEKKLEAVAKHFDQQIGRLPNMDKVKNAEKQQLVESAFLASAWLMGVTMNALETQDTKTLEEAKLAIKQMIAPLDADESNLKAMLENMGS